MNKEHNPVSIELDKMYDVWKANVDDKTALVRWLIPQSDRKMYEIFCRIECTAEGRLEDVTIGLISGLRSEDSFSADLVKEWIKNFQDQQKELAKQGFERTWEEAESLLERANKTTPPETILQETIASFRKAMDFEDDRWLNLALVPYSIEGGIEYTKWLISIYEAGLPKMSRLIVADYIDNMQLKHVHTQFPETTTNLPVPLDLQGAMRKVAESGEANDPEVIFRKCLFKMSDAAKDKNSTKVIEWGNKAVQTATQTGKPDFQGIAFITYAGMLLSFKGNEHDVKKLLDRGYKVVKPASENDDVSCQQLRIQFYGYQAALCMQENNKQGAIDWHIVQGKYAKSLDLNPQAMSAFRLAAYYAADGNPTEAYECLDHAYQAGTKLSDEEKEFSEFRFVALEFFDYLRLEGRKDEAKQLNEDMTKIFGANWEKEIRKQTEEIKHVPDTQYA